MKSIRLALLAAVLGTVVLATGCGVLSEDLKTKNVNTGIDTASVEFDAITSTEHETYQLAEYGLAYSTNPEDLQGVETGESHYTPQQNYPRAQVVSMLVQPAEVFGPRALVTKTVNLEDLESGTTYYFVPFIYGNYSNDDAAPTTAYGYASEVGNFTTIMTTPARVVGLKLGRQKHAIALAWSRVTGATGYEVYRSASASDGFTKVKTAGSNKYTNGSLRRGVRYYYKVCAYRTVSGVKYFGEFSRTISETCK